MAEERAWRERVRRMWVRRALMRRMWARRALMQRVPLVCFVPLWSVLAQAATPG